MIHWPRLALVPLGLALHTIASCAPADPKDYSQFREHMPASILVLPPTNQSVEVNAGYSVMSSITTPLAAAGYYVFPIAVADTYFKENGLPSPADMHGVPLDKISEVFGADAVLYLDVKNYGQDYKVVFSDTEVDVDAKLVDTATGLTLWEGRAHGRKSSSDGNTPLVVALLVVVSVVAMVVPPSAGSPVVVATGFAHLAASQRPARRDGFAAKYRRVA
ncbi:MAG: DUF799 family lipoprotein [Rhizobiales bacterium]|nr:DUF799 family lipoprotein [Hyphomicrobiales bacterium]